MITSVTVLRLRVDAIEMDVADRVRLLDLFFGFLSAPCRVLARVLALSSFSSNFFEWLERNPDARYLFSLLLLQQLFTSIRYANGYLHVCFSLSLSYEVIAAVRSVRGS